VDPDAPSHGAFATRVHVAARRVIAVPDGLSDVEAALVEPTAVTYHAVRRVGAELGSVTVVQGAGPIGLLTAQNAGNAGAGPLIISEPNAARRELASRLGFADVVEPADLGAALADLTGGLGRSGAFGARHLHVGRNTSSTRRPAGGACSARHCPAEPQTRYWTPTSPSDTRSARTARTGPCWRS